MANSPPHDVVFDFDGVIGDSAPLIIEVLRTVLDRELGLSIDAADLRDVVGPPLHHALSDLFTANGVIASPDTIDDVVRHFRNEYGARAPTETRMFPGTREAILELAGFARVSICSSKPRPLLEAILREWDGSAWFDDVEAPDPNQAEPKAAGLSRLIARLGAHAGSTTLIGDTVFDAQAATETGIAFIGVAWGIGKPEELSAAGAQAIATDARDLIHLVKGLQR